MRALKKKKEKETLLKKREFTKQEDQIALTHARNLHSKKQPSRFFRHSAKAAAVKGAPPPSPRAPPRPQTAQQRANFYAPFTTKLTVGWELRTCPTNQLPPLSYPDPESLRVDMGSSGIPCPSINARLITQARSLYRTAKLDVAQSTFMRE